MLQQRPIITVLTDFGLQDEYVAVMKGVLLCHCRDAQIVDISHTIAPQDIRQASQLLTNSVPYFPEESIHLAVVDPGVGSSRKILLLRVAGQWFIAPDNGLLTPFLQSTALQGCYELQVEEHPRSATFHGRDIMAPAAGELAAGADIAAIARPVSKDSCVVLPPPGLHISTTKIIGEVTGIDHFGNIATSISREVIEQLENFSSDRAVITLGNHCIHGIKKTYCETVPGQLLALIDSRGYLEIACNQGHAADRLAIQQSCSVTLTLQD